MLTFLRPTIITFRHYEKLQIISLSLVVVSEDLSPLFFIFLSVLKGNLYSAFSVPVFNLFLQPVVTDLFQTAFVAGFVLLIVASGISVMIGK